MRKRRAREARYGWSRSRIARESKGRGKTVRRRLVGLSVRENGLENGRAAGSRFGRRGDRQGLVLAKIGRSGEIVRRRVASRFVRGQMGRRAEKEGFVRQIGLAAVRDLPGAGRFDPLAIVLLGEPGL